MSEETPLINLEHLEEMLRHAPFHRWLGLEIISCTDAHLKLKMPWRAEIVSNPAIGAAHGGVLASLIDLTGLYALVAKGAKAKATADLRVDYHRPVTNGPLTCLLYTSPSPRDQRGSRMPSSA